MRTEITHLKLSNFRNIPELDIDFHSGYNEIAGENGVGKTTILTAITYALFGKDIFNKKQFSIQPIIDGVEQKDIEVKEKEKEELAPVQKEEKQVPLAEKNSQESLLKNSSKTLRKQEGNTNMKKKSVREDLKEIKEELAKENKTSSKSKDLSKNTKQAPNKTKKEKSR